MIRESHSAVVTRNETWTGTAASEPYEAGWAAEAIFFVRALDAPPRHPEAQMRVQISADGMHWVDEGTRCALPQGRDEVTFAKVREFGNWLRLEADVPDGPGLNLLITLSLKA